MRRRTTRRQARWRWPRRRVAVTLQAALGAHVADDPSEADSLSQIRAFVHRHAQPFDRTIGEGHLTGSAVVIDASASRTLLVFHRKLGRWLQPGGHAEAGERDGAAVALREATEETGLTQLSLHPHAPQPLDVDVHLIPARRDDPAHLHLDLRYLVVAEAGAALDPAAVEVADVRWVTWDALDTLALDPGLLRALRKARRYGDAAIMDVTTRTARGHVRRRR
jgi:8-oxo-dGTP pyrophosphatase MutT (NUDIX family)